VLPKLSHLPLTGMLAFVVTMLFVCGAAVCTLVHATVLISACAWPAVHTAQPMHMRGSGPEHNGMICVSSSELSAGKLGVDTENARAGRKQVWLHGVQLTAQAKPEHGSAFAHCHRAHFCKRGLTWCAWYLYILHNAHAITSSSCS
jgi:hypothetical protein